MGSGGGVAVSTTFISTVTGRETFGGAVAEGADSGSLPPHAARSKLTTSAGATNVYLMERVRLGRRGKGRFCWFQFAENRPQ